MCTRHTSAAVGSIAVIALALAGCGNDDSAADSTATSLVQTPAPGPATTPAAPTTAAPTTAAPTTPAPTTPAPTTPGSTTGVVPIDPGDGGNDAPQLDPADFADVIDNQYFPFAVGTRWVYEGEDDGETERVEVVVTDQRREILRISATVVRDTVFVDGEMVEDTFDWFAQDREGNVWYLGEDTREFENGVAVNASGAWEAGLDGALPGIVMRAEPAVGDAYRQEFYAGEAEDMARIVRIEPSREVAAGSYDDVLVTEDWTPLEPDVLEEKWYAPGVGLIGERKIAGGNGFIELIEFTPGS